MSTVLFTDEQDTPLWSISDSGKTIGKFELHLGSCDLLLTLLERPLCNEKDKSLLDRSIHLLEKMRAELLQLFQEFAEAFDGAALHRDSWDASALHIAFSADPGRWAYAAGHHNRRLKEDELAILDHHWRSVG